MINLHKTRFHSWTAGGSGGGGGGGMDIKVKVSASDTTTGFLSEKLVNTDGTATFTILNAGGNEQYDISVGGVISITVLDAQDLITNLEVIPNQLYLITDAYNNTCQIFMWGVSTTAFDNQGYGSFTNANTITPIQCLMKYIVEYDKVTEVYFPKTNVRLVQSFDESAFSSVGNVVDVFPMFTNFTYFNSSIEDSNLSGAFLSSSLLTLNASRIANCNLNIADSLWFCQNSEIVASTINDPSNLAGAGSFGSTKMIGVVSNATNGLSFGGCNFEGGGITINENGGAFGSSLSYCYFGAETIVNLESSGLFGCRILNNAEITLVDSSFTNCNVGVSKKVFPPAGYNATNASIEDLDSTFEVFLDPDGAGVMDMVDYKFAGIVRIGASGVPATWDLKEIQNFPTDHIFCIIPADSNFVDIYDAGAGGVNIYLNTASVVTYDGTKDDTLVVRSGLNNYLRLFQIGGWQAPSA